MDEELQTLRDKAVLSYNNCEVCGSVCSHSASQSLDKRDSHKSKIVS